MDGRQRLKAYAIAAIGMLADDHRASLLVPLAFVALLSAGSRGRVGVPAAT